MCEVIPGGVNSPVRAFHCVGEHPVVAAYGVKDLVYDEDGNHYIDYCGSWGALIHGHAHPTIVKAVQKRVGLGSSFGITTAIEGKLAKEISKIIPSVEKIRFVSSGTEATMSAARLARGYTQRDLIIKFAGNYHGHADFFLVQAGSGVIGLTESSSAGIPKEMVQNTLSLPFNDVEAFLKVIQDPKIKNKVAAVILEPISGNMGVIPAKKEFMKAISQETKRIGALLIFDEVITGFRVGLRGAQDLYKVTPDLTCFGKIIGGGFPVAAFGGRKEIMHCLAPLGQVYQAGTLSGNPVAMEAGLQAIQLLQAATFYDDLESKANLITKPVAALLRKKQVLACVQQVGSMFTLFFGKNQVENLQDAQNLDSKTYAKFFHYLLQRGIYVPPSQHEAWFVSSVHEQKHLEKTRDHILEFINAELTSYTTI